MYILLLKLTIIVLSSLGLWGVGIISLSHWSNEIPCPTIGVIPVCYIILVAYGLILLSVLFPFKSSLTIFLVGWTTVILLALIGAVGEITSTLSCPASEIGIPKCYLSAILSSIIGALYWLFFKAKQSE